MRIIYCSFFLPKRCLAKRLFGIWFVRKGVAPEEEVRKMIEFEELRIKFAKEFGMKMNFWDYIKSYKEYKNSLKRKGVSNGD